jgi:hypothetical protein
MMPKIFQKRIMDLNIAEIELRLNYDRGAPVKYIEAEAFNSITLRTRVHSVYSGNTIKYIH